MTAPVLGITMGDVSGIGPEITAKTLLRHPDLRSKARLLVVGDADAMKRGAQIAGLDPGCVRTIAHPRECTGAADRIEVLQTGPSLSQVRLGEVDPAAGDGAYRFVVEACRLSKEKSIDGIVTAPLNKTALHAAGHMYPGHTELLAEQFGVKNFSLVLSAGELYVFHITTHMSLQQAIEHMTKQRVLDVIRLSSAFSQALGVKGEPIALAGLNPHAGENGLFGTEERDAMEPAVAEAKRLGIDVRGPLPADAVIPQAFRGRWKFLIVCYHDQGHAPFKSVYGDKGVNITVGLPVVRVSVDHGTAFDIAGKGVADESSLVLSVERAAALAPRWNEIWSSMKSEVA